MGRVLADYATVLVSPSQRRRGRDMADAHKYNVGYYVMLNKHEDIPGYGTNWEPDMDQYVGRLTVILSLGPKSPAGIWTYLVDADNRHWYWRESALTCCDSSGRPLVIAATADPVIAYGRQCNKCFDFNQYIPSTQKDYVCYGCRH
jgi:hypothetical protein